MRATGDDVLSEGVLPTSLPDNPITDQAEMATIDNWLLSRTHSITKKVTESLDTAELRWGVNDSFFVMQNDLRWYFQRGGENQTLVEDFVKRQLTMLSPYIPQTVEELSKSYFPDDNLTGSGSWPAYDQSLIAENEETLEQMLFDTRRTLNGALHKKGKNLVGQYEGVVIYVLKEEERSRIVDGVGAIKETTGVDWVDVKLSSEVRETDFTNPGLFMKYSRVDSYSPKFQLVRRQEQVS